MQVAVVTGGGSGIGRGIALALARRGIALALVGRRAEPLRQVAAQAQALGVPAIALPGDITVAAFRQELCAAVRAELGPPRVLVCAAGMLGGGGLAQLDPATIETTVATNLVAPAELVRLLRPELAAQRGAVVLVGSMASLMPLPYASVYSASKAGLRAFAAALRYELEAEGVRLLIAHPPGTNTAMLAGRAQAAGLPAALIHMAEPEAVGERIVAALESGRGELVWPSGEGCAARLYTLAPWLLRWVLRSQRTRFARMFGSHESD